MQIKVMSYNTWLGKYPLGIADHIAQMNPDIIGLQEIVEGYPSSQSPNTAYFIRDLLAEKGINYSVAYFPAFKSDRHPTKHKIGNAILSYFPIKKARCHFLSDLEMYQNRNPLTPPRDAEPRIAIETQIEVDGKIIRVINTHLGVSENLKPTQYTDIQMEKLMALIKVSKGTVLMGDFNVTPDSDYIKRIGKVLKNCDAIQLPTWPLSKDAVKWHNKQYGVTVARPLLLTHRLDQIFVSSEICVNNFTLGESPASDHKSLLAFLEINKV